MYATPSFLYIYLYSFRPILFLSLLGFVYVLSLRLSPSLSSPSVCLSLSLSLCVCVCVCVCFRFHVFCRTPHPPPLSPIRHPPPSQPYYPASPPSGPRRRHRHPPLSPCRPHVSSRAPPVRYAAPDCVSHNSAYTPAATATASTAANSSVTSNRRQLSELGSGLRGKRNSNGIRSHKEASAGTIRSTRLGKRHLPPQSPPWAPSSPASATDRVITQRNTDSPFLPSQSPQKHQQQEQRERAPLPSTNYDPLVVASAEPSLSRFDYPIQSPPCYYSPSPVLVTAAPPPFPSPLLQETQQLRHVVRRRGVATAATQAVMEPGIHPQPHPSASSSSPYSQSASSSQQYLQIRTDTTVVSSINSSAADQSSKSASAAIAASSSGPSYEGLCMAVPHSPVTAPVHQPYTARAQQSQAPHHRTSPKGRSSPHRFAVSNTSMACSSVGDADNLGLHRRHNNPREAYGGQRQNSLGHQLQQQHNHHQTDALPQSLERRSSDVVDAVSRSLNTHNDPELEGLPPMRCNNEGEDEMGGRAGRAVGAAGHATTLYSKGFLIATASAKDSSASRGNDGGSTYIPPHLHNGKEQQMPRDDGEASLSQASQSRSPLASTSTGISHRLLTADEINERRRASWAASRSVSQVHSAVASPAAGDNAGGHQKAGYPLVSVQSAHNNLSTASGVSKVSRPAHRQLTKEEANQLIAHRQQQRTAEALALAAAAKDVPAQQQQHELSSLLANTPNNNQSGILHSAPPDSAKPWLLSGDGTQANYFPPEPASTPPVASTSTLGDGGNTLTKPMVFEWLRGTNGGDTGGVGGGASGAGFFSESTAHSWPGVNGWRDSNVVGSSANGGNVNTAMAAFLGAAGGAAGDGGSNGNFNASAVALGRAGQAPGGTSTTAFTWLPNTSNWSPRNQEQQQQQQQQQQQALFSFVPATPPQVGAVSGGAHPSTWGYSNTAMGFTGGSLRSGLLTFLSSPPTPAALQGVSQERIEECIRQCDGQLVQLRHEREQLVQELQRRLYASADSEKQQQQQQQQQHNHADTASWPGALGPHAVTIPSSLMNTITVESAMLPRGTATAETGAIGGGGSAVRQRPLWPFFDDLIVDGNGVAKTLPRGPVDTRELPSPYMEPAMEVDSAEWAGRAPTAAASHQQTCSSGSATVVGPAHQAAASTGALGRSVGHWTAGERSGGRGRRRAETGNQRNNNDGNNNGASSSAGAMATTFSAGGGGHSNNNRCSHDNTPQEQKYLQTDPFSMYMHNKKIATAGVPTTRGSSKAAAA
ncbi:hypothetical protein LMJF_15_0630 [Leishmania major strain Friedlin]|uniref:Uncharacterized protein n=1 Tax=Leishmania major TaxID=5664 RepID=Q4QFC2_LEIMA|nr:hypothetical protein LMJF_15_0630 [Leishmania major strain Friedlin]CAG9571412.1 hypothetical_protein_-_conserved [Leishmania major strain Friedlin]CAJ03287.1 hypothetical protein LMJF_15_0630 [Leishmania major strain Friedlin]|eukprot:XP_001681976.1 hypothetical protein LMJF_15_0630 [Leishmania major strain Friedlin]